MKTLRWIGVLPCAFLALVLGALFLRFSITFAGADPEGILIQMFIGFVSAIAYIYVGVAVAPSYKVRTAIVIMIIALLFAIGNLYVINFVQENYAGNLREFCAIAGLIFYTIVVYKHKGNPY